MTKACLLQVKDVLVDLRDAHPHSLNAVDITDPENKEWWDRYVCMCTICMYACAG